MLSHMKINKKNVLVSVTSLKLNETVFQVRTIYMVLKDRR